MRFRTEPPGKRARFFWQGALILLPALVLAGAGLYSLRQDDVLARHEAGEQARQIATEWAEQVIPQALQFDLPEETAVRRPAAGPEDEALYRLRRSPLVGTAILTDGQGLILYPPRPAGMPSPRPLDEGELAPRQQDAWLALENVWRGEPPVSDRELVEFLATEPPERFAMLAQFRTALALARAGQAQRATTLLRAARDAPEELVGESGVPLRWLAEWQFIAWLPETDRALPLQALAARLVLEPSPVAHALLAKLQPLHPSMRGWVLVQEEHDKAHEWAAALAADPAAGVVDFQGRPHLAVAQPVSGGQWTVAVPLDALTNEIARLNRSMVLPAAFGVAVSVGSESLLQRPGDRPSLALSSSGSLPIAVEVFLKDPAGFDAQRRARTRRIGALIALSAGAVVVGFFSAWRAFRRQQQLSEMKGNFVSSVSHELRAPIASVRLMAEELEQGAAPSAEKVRQYLRFIGQECRRLSAVIENVLDFSRREQGREHFDFEATDMAALVGETVSLMRTYAAERGVRLATVTHGIPQPVVADGRALQRLLVNLIDNAQKHAPEGSEVTVGLEFSDPLVSLWVEDRGLGIPRHEQARIFERFYRVGSELQRQTQGVGLGLSIVKHLAEVHGGRVRVRSDVGQGSRFTVELPLNTAPRARLESMTA
jgi:signal transduction histidine kinase